MALTVLVGGEGSGGMRSFLTVVSTTANAMQTVWNAEVVGRSTSHLSVWDAVAISIDFCSGL